MAYKCKRCMDTGCACGGIGLSCYGCCSCEANTTQKGKTTKPLPQEVRYATLTTTLAVLGELMANKLDSDQPLSAAFEMLEAEWYTLTPQTYKNKNGRREYE